MKKKLVKRLRQIANDLPDTTYAAYPKKVITNSDHELADPITGKLLRSTKKTYKVNHLRRLKKAVTLYGFDKGVEVHMTWMLNRLNKNNKKFIND